jgi:RTX calcium-binding nonapeptide repeat (4 copies)
VRRIGILVPVVAMLLGSLAPSAWATTASTSTFMDPTQGNVLETQLDVTAAPGETNAITITADTGANRSAVVRDSGAPITAGTGCAPLDATAVRCAGLSTIDRTVVLLGDGDDTLAISPGLIATVDGGDGADRITGGGDLSGGAGNDLLVGGPFLTGGPGDDELHGTPGDDQLYGDAGPLGGSDAAGNDLIDGGAGHDRTGYEGRTQPVHVDLSDPGPDGGPGEHDTLLGIEDVAGGDGADVLIGDDQSNFLNGSRGDDRIEGRGGRDFLLGGLGRDTVFGGAGDDSITTDGPGDIAHGDSGKDELRSNGKGARLDGGSGNDTFALTSGSTTAAGLVCGRGVDVVEGTLRRQRVDDCELLDAGGARSLRLRLRIERRSSGRLITRIDCAPAFRCVGTLTLRLLRHDHPAIVLGRDRFRIRGSARHVMRLTPSVDLSHRKRPLLDVRLSGRSRLTTGFAQRVSGRWQIRLPHKSSS